MFEVNEQMKFMGYGHLSPMRPISQFDTGPNNIKNVLYDMNKKLDSTLKYLEERKFAPLISPTCLPLEVKTNFDFLNTYVHKPSEIHDVWPEKKNISIFSEKPLPTISEIALRRYNIFTRQFEDRD